MVNSTPFKQSVIEKCNVVILAPLCSKTIVFEGGWGVQVTLYGTSWEVRLTEETQLDIIFGTPWCICGGVGANTCRKGRYYDSCTPLQQNHNFWWSRGIRTSPKVTLRPSKGTPKTYLKCVIKTCLPVFASICSYLLVSASIC